MVLPQDFRTMDFLGQITLLSALDKERRTEAIQELFELLAEPVGDKSVDYMVANTLRSLLLASEEGTVRGLGYGSPIVLRFCCLVVAQCRYMSAAPILMRLAESEADPDLLSEILNALSKLKLPESLPLFKRQLGNADMLISSLAIEAIGALKDASTLPILQGIITEAESDQSYETCDLKTWKAIEAVRDIGTIEAVEFLASAIHHRNPTARRIIHQALIDLGAQCIPSVAAHFDGKDTDSQIMAANIIGMLGDKSGADRLVEVLDRGAAANSNVRFALYEALGRIPSLKGLICLVDGLEEADPMLLMAVVTGLEQRLNPGLVAKLRSRLAAKDEQSGRILDTIVRAKAVDLFEALYKDEAIATAIVDRVESMRDPDAAEAFGKRLRSMTGDRQERDAARLASSAAPVSARRMLAVDDSKAMLMFYKSTAPELGLDVTTAGNGQAGLDIVENGETFDLIVVDMNMPIMDGIEFTRRLRALPGFTDVPVIMATTESERSQTQLAEKAGVNVFLGKPFTQEALVAAVSSLLRKGS